MTGQDFLKYSHFPTAGRHPVYEILCDCYLLDTCINTLHKRHFQKSDCNHLMKTEEVERFTKIRLKCQYWIVRCQVYSVWLRMWKQKFNKLSFHYSLWNNFKHLIMWHLCWNLSHSKTELFLSQPIHCTYTYSRVRSHWAVALAKW